MSTGRLAIFVCTAGEHLSSSASLCESMLEAELNEFAEEHCSILEEILGSGNV
jgi:hypothetical protein